MEVAPWDPHCPSGMPLGPTDTFLLQNYSEWLQELKEKGPELLKQLPVNTEPSSVSMAHTLALVGCHLLSHPQEGRCPELFYWAAGETRCLV